MGEDFDLFWSKYPKRVGKFAAMKAYTKALSCALPEEILSGLETFRQHLPEDAQYIPHASTWLNQGRWMDEYELPVKTVHKAYVPLRFRKESA